MSQTSNEGSPPKIEISMRIPGAWEGPSELRDRLGDGIELRSNSLLMPDGSEYELFAMPPDDQFAEICRTSIRGDVTDTELEKVNNYTVNVGLVGPGGTVAAALAMMRAASAIISAGGAAVFIDNCVLAHGGTQWKEMTDSASIDAISFAYINLVGGDDEVSTMGMQSLGLPEITMSRSDEDKLSIIAVVQYLCEADTSDNRLDEGHILADLDGPKFIVHAEKSERLQSSSPMFNPWGHYRLVSFKEIAENN